MNEKTCTCPEPTTTVPVIDGYRGKVKCTCGGSFDYPSKPTHPCADPIEAWVNKVESNHNESGVVTVLLRLLLRIDSRLADIAKNGTMFVKSENDENRDASYNRSAGGKPQKR